MAGYPSNLAKKFSPTEQFPQHILPLLLLYNAQWWVYESLTTIVLVTLIIIVFKGGDVNKPINQEVYLIDMFRRYVSDYPEGPGFCENILYFLMYS